MVFKVSYSQNKDINNYINSVWHFSYKKHGREGMQEKLLKFFPNEFKEKIRNTQTKKQAITTIKDYLDNLPQGVKNQISVITIGVEKILNDHRSEITKLLESMYKKPFPFDTITVFLTTLGICPYNYDEKWFMSRHNNSVKGHISTAKHELNHFMFYYYYRDKLKEQSLSEEKIEKLKEALAILTNPEGNNKPDINDLEVFIQSQKDKTLGQIIKSSLSSNFL